MSKCCLWRALWYSQMNEKLLQTIVAEVSDWRSACSGSFTTCPLPLNAMLCTPTPKADFLRNHTHSTITSSTLLPHTPHLSPAHPLLPPTPPTPPLLPPPPLLPLPHSSPSPTPPPSPITYLAMCRSTWSKLNTGRIPSTLTSTGRTAFSSLTSTMRM